MEPEREVEVAAFDLGTVLLFTDLAVSGLSAAREEIDALNVYPVPDGDTGTNMYFTVEAAQVTLREHLAAEPGQVGPALKGYARGALLGARGNSGVILSQLVGALVRQITKAGPQDRAASVFAEGMARAADAAYAAVGTPVEGTMLTVARDAADAAGSTSDNPEARLADVVRAAAAAARAALARTPDQLAVLAQAGVVDAGGAGLCVILDAAETALTGRRPLAGTVHAPLYAPHPLGARGMPVPNRPEAAGATQGGELSTDELRADGPAYEVMYLLDADDQAVTELRKRLQPLGDSLVVVGGEGLWNVHVHVDDVGAAVEAGISAGAPHRIQVTHFAEQTERARRRQERRGRRVVAVAAGAGLAAVFADAGAEVLQTAPGRRPSTAQVLEAIERSGAREVIVLPNDADSVGVAEAAAHAAAQAAEEADPVRVVVIPTRAQVQGLAALAVHEPGRSFDSDVVHMTATARGVRHGAVTIAARQAMTSAGRCEVGDVLGVVQGDFAVIGSEQAVVAIDVLERLLGGGELVTIVTGADDESAALATICEEHVAAHHPGVDVVVYDGRQARYLLLIGVE
ncbi:MAG: DAK2 domain-containing protein [Actinomycetota bacterium]|nr:DAK2 domain-containing protein [Actinomycetota bacterium]